jgi:guanine nucleotide-binding protein G(i) subunit alpha
LLGSGDVGKSAIVNHLKYIYGGGLDIEWHQNYMYSIRSSLIERMIDLLRNCQSLDSTVSPVNEETKNAFLAFVNPKPGIYDQKTLSDLLKSEEINVLGNGDGRPCPELAPVIKDLWKEQAIQQAYKKMLTSTVSGSEAIEYFVNRADVIFASDCEPSFEDCLRCYIRNVGICDCRFEVSGANFCFCATSGTDGGSRGIITHRCEYLSGIILVASLSEYDHIYCFDGVRNRMDVSFGCFGMIFERQILDGMPIILVLNKRDVLRKKIKTNPLKSRFPEYSGGDSVEAAENFIKEMFMAQVPESSKNRVHIIFLNALDPDDIQFLFSEVSRIVVKNCDPDDDVKVASGK